MLHELHIFKRCLKRPITVIYHRFFVPLDITSPRREKKNFHQRELTWKQCISPQEKSQAFS